MIMGSFLQKQQQQQLLLLACMVLLATAAHATDGADSAIAVGPSPASSTGKSTGMLKQLALIHPCSSLVLQTA